MEQEREHTSWRELFARSLDLGLGALTLTKEAAQKAMDELVHKGEISREESKHLVERMLERGKEQKEHLDQLVRDAVDKALHKADLARASELRDARARVAELQARLDKLEMDMTAGRPPHEPPL